MFTYNPLDARGLIARETASSGLDEPTITTVVLSAACFQKQV